MEHYIEIIVMLAPGLIAKEIARALGNIKVRSTSIDQILNYFVYSTFCLLVLFLLYGFISPHISNSSTNLMLFMTLSIISGIVVGTTWQLSVKKIFKRMVDAITSKKDGYTYFQEDSLLNNCMLDGKDHLIQLVKSGKVVATGKFLGATFSSDDTVEIKIDSHPIYTEWLSSEEFSEHFEYLHSIFDINNDIEVREYSYPEGFFEEGFSAEKITS